jgi:long-chain fatty acid transport protein
MGVWHYLLSNLREIFWTRRQTRGLFAILTYPERFGIFRLGSIPKCHKGGSDMKAKRSKRMGKPWMVSLVGTLGLAMLSTSAYGAGFELHEQGAKAVAMGTAFVAQADDPSAVFYNPAGITQLEGSQVSIGVSVVRPYGKFQSNGNPAMGSLPGDTTSNQSRYYFLANNYITYKLSKYFTLGYGGFTNFGLGAEWPRDFEGRFTPGAMKTVLTTLCMSPVIAVKPIEQVSFAIGPVIQRADLNIKNLAFVAAPATFPLTPNSNIPETAEVKVKGYDWAVGYNIGLLIHLPYHFQFGTSYMSGVHHDFTKEYQKVFLANGLVLRQGAEFKLNLPDAVKFGLAWKKDPWTLEGDAQWIEWSSYHRTITTFDNGTFSAQPKDWHNVWSWQLGAQYRLSKYFDLRAGFRYEESPIPKHTLDPIVPSGNRKVYCAGIGTHLGSLTLDLAYNYVKDETRKWNNSSGDVNVGPVTLTRVTGKFVDGSAHVISANVSYKF